jgi:HSP20 family protein
MELSLRRYEERPLDLRRENRLFTDFERRMDSLFDEVFGGSLVSYVVPESRGLFSPSIDIKETGNSIEISAEMPGINPENIDVSVHDGVLTISGEKKVEKEEKETSYQHVERSYGCFSREISLPDRVESEKIVAGYKNGVLTVTLPKTEKAMKQSRKVPISAA